MFILYLHTIFHKPNSNDLQPPLFPCKERQYTKNVPKTNQNTQTLWPESASELYQPSDRCLSAKLMPTFADRGCHVVSVMHPYGHILIFLDRSRYFFFQAARKLYSRGSVDPVPDPLLLKRYGSAENRTRTSKCVAKNTDH
jgi:hypothetical protein